MFGLNDIEYIPEWLALGMKLVMGYTGTRLAIAAPWHMQLLYVNKLQISYETPQMCFPYFFHTFRILSILINILFIIINNTIN